MFFWRRVAPQSPEDGLKPTATPSYTRNFREINRRVAEGKSFSGYERNALYLNLQGKGFADVGGLFGVDFDDDARAVASIDWDRDGDLDMWVTNRTGPQVRLLRNSLPARNSFVAIHLIGDGKSTNRDAVGARLTLWRSSEPGSKQIRTIHAGDGFLSQSSAWTHFGLGQTTADLQLAITWPGGGTETFSNLKPDTHYEITQGQRPRIVASPPLPEIVPTAGGDRSDDLDQSGFWVANRVPLPELTYLDDKGAVRSTTNFLGKPFLINLWATWCAPCLEELSVFSKQAPALRAQGATVLALNVDGLAVDRATSPAASAEDVLTRLGYELPHGRARQESLAKIEVLIEFLSSRRAPLSIPSSFLVDAEGNVAAVYPQPVHWDQLANDLALLSAPPATQLRRLSPRPGRWVADPRRLDRAAYLGDYATLFVTSGLAEEAQRLYQMIKPEHGIEDAGTYYNRAKIAAQQGRKAEAMESYRAAIRLEPQYGPALVGLGALLLMEKRIDEAQLLFEQALRVDPNHATALVNLATIDQARGDNQRAIERLKTVIARNPDYAEAHLNLGSLLAAMKRFDEAIQHLSKAIDLNPNRDVAYLNLAAAYTETGQWDQAAALYRRVLSLDPRLAHAHFGLGMLQARQERHAAAVESFRQAIALGGANARTYTQLGLSLFALRQQQAAVDALQKALELDPREEAARRALQANGFSPSK
jgi:tetratricopeptide (TPR) repeat protein